MQLTKRCPKMKVQIHSYWSPKAPTGNLDLTQVITVSY
jgi:hypothetical protein